LLHPIHAAVDIVVDFNDQFIRMEAENAQLREAAKSSTDQLQEANRLADEARKENAILKKDLKQPKKKMKEEEQSKLKAQAQAYKKEGALRKSIESLLGKTPSPHLFLLSCGILSL
jgi:dsDNA-specific endonuclease/ATPase MutS2